MRSINGVCHSDAEVDMYIRVLTNIFQDEYAKIKGFGPPSETLTELKNTLSSNITAVYQD
jgi:hypothetical protein